MKNPFACAFIELLVSDDNTNYASYLLNFFPVRYKACRSMWKFSQLSAKIKVCNLFYSLIEKMFRSIFVSIQTKFYSLWAFIIRKSKMPEIRLNCLAVPSNLPVDDNMSLQSILTPKNLSILLDRKLKKNVRPVLMTFQSQNS